MDGAYVLIDEFYKQLKITCQFTVNILILQGSLQDVAVLKQIDELNYFFEYQPEKQISGLVLKSVKNMFNR